MLRDGSTSSPARASCRFSFACSARGLMAQRRASSTMIGSVILRATHQVLDADPKILDDPLAVGLVEGSSREEIMAIPPDSLPPTSVPLPLCNPFVTPRTRSERPSPMVSGSTCCSVQGWIHFLPPAELGGKASHL